MKVELIYLVTKLDPAPEGDAITLTARLKGVSDTTSLATRLLCITNG